MNPLREAKRRLFPKGVRRSAENLRRRLFERTTERSLAATLEELSIPRGAVVCIHARLSALGYLVGGAAALLRAVRRAVPDCTIMMPTFPFESSMLDHLATCPVYDVGRTPSQSGMLSEALRLDPGARRSHHPTHPCAALGPAADALIDGSEASPTPFGDESTYGRFSRMENAFLLLVHTNNTSLVHRFQEIVDMPNLFLAEEQEALGHDGAGKLASYRLKVHRPQIPLFVLMEGSTPDCPEYVWMPDYCLPCPDDNRRRILGNLESEAAGNLLLGRHEELASQGVIRTVSRSGADLQAIHVPPWQERICQDLRTSIEVFRDEYRLDRMERALAAGKLHK